MRKRSNVHPPSLVHSDSNQLSKRLVTYPEFLRDLESLGKV